MPFIRYLALLTVGLIAWEAAPAHAQTASRFNPSSPEELRDLGRSILAEQVSSTGRDLNPTWRKDVSMIIDSVRNAAAYRAHPVVWDIISDSSLNAAALPGGVMLINVGLPLFCTELGNSTAPGDADAARRAYIGCLAAVVGHEFGHLALGHSDSVAAMIQRRRDIASRRRRAGGIVAAVGDSVLMQGLQLERAREIEADEAGALYLLRSGWEVQDAIDLHMAMDSVNRREQRWQGELTWLNGHPRSVERAALLEVRRAQLKLSQRDFDDALSLIQHDVMPDSALAMLDRVLTNLPYLPAARHARAVLLARRWMGTASVADLKVRPTLPAYDAQFMASIKGGNATALRLAREAFRHALAADAHPYTLANLAVLDAYAGDAALARRRAQAAAQRMPNDADVQNNLGVVHFLAGRVEDARRAFARAEELLDDELTPSVAFNVARATLAAGDTAAARPLLERYVMHDNSSAWGREAAAMLRQARAPSASTNTATGGTGSSTGVNTNVPASRAPMVAGVRLGTPASQVFRALGRPGSADGDATGVVWRYPDRGVTLLIHPEHGVLVVLLEARDAGEIAGVRVGDPVAAAQRVLGPAAEREHSGNGEMLRFDRGTWSISLIATDSVVRAVGMALEVP